MKKKVLTVAIAGALAAPMAAQAIEHSVSGHVNRMIRFADDGKASDIQQLDNSASQTRIRWRGTGDIGRGMKASILIETGVSSANSSGVGIKANNDGSSDTAFNIRHSTLNFQGRWGRLTLGHTAPAGDGIADQDLSGTGIASGYDIFGDSAGAISYRTNGGAAVPVTIGDAIGTLDGGRKDILRYDSPALGPATIAASVGNDSYFDVGVYINTNLGGGQLALAGGWIKSDQYGNRDTSGSTTTVDTTGTGCPTACPATTTATPAPNGHQAWAISAAYLFSQGTSIQGTYSERNFKKRASARPKAKNWHVKVGHKWGNNAVSVSYGEGKDKAADGVKGKGLSVGFVHTIPKPGVELYAGYNFNQLSMSSAYRTANTNGNKAKDINVFFVGSRVQFN